MVKHPTARMGAALAALALLILAGCSSSGWVRPVPQIRPEHALLNVIYPRASEKDTVLAPGDSIVFEPAPDSLFLLGHVANTSGQLTINGHEVAIHEDGGWLAWVPRGELKQLPDTCSLAPGTYATVTIHYESEPYGDLPAPSVTRRVHFVQPEVVGPEPDEMAIRPRRVRLNVTSPTARIRCGWPGTSWIYPPVGTALEAVGVTGYDIPFWRVKLGDGDAGYIEDRYVQVDSLHVPPPRQVVHKVLSEAKDRRTTVRIPLQARVPFRIERTGDEQLELTIYNAVSWTDLIVQPHGSRAVDELRWAQPDSATYKLTAYLDPEWFWGWDADYADDSTLVWTIHHAPVIRERPLDDLMVVVDPGHGGSNYSAIGPTGLPEKTVNLWLSREVIRELRDAGARVVATRTDDRTLGLLERIDFAREMEADLLISLHHNALPQGKNPHEHHGVSLHYYHRHAHKLAGAIYEAMTANGWPGDGLRYQDLAMARPGFLPAVLLEAGFMIHPEEEAQLRRQQYHERQARQLRLGIESYLRELRRAQQRSLQLEREMHEE